MCKKAEEAADGFFGKQLNESNLDKSGPDKPMTFGVSMGAAPEYPVVQMKNFDVKDTTKQNLDDSIYHVRLKGIDIESGIGIFTSAIKGAIPDVDVKHITDFALDFPIAVTVKNPESNQNIVNIFGSIDDKITDEKW